VDNMIGNGRYKQVLDDINSRKNLGDGIGNTMDVIYEMLQR